MNKIKPTKKQKQTFLHMSRAKSLQDAMLAGGYSKSSSLKPKQNFTDSKGFQVLVEQYRGDLIRAGVSSEILAEVQAEGLFDQDAKVRLDYLKETKKDFGLPIQGDNDVNVQVNVIPILGKIDVHPNYSNQENTATP
jgi:hypothetical protein